MLNLIAGLFLFLIPSASVSSHIIYLNSSHPNATDNRSCWEGNPDLPCKSVNTALIGAHVFNSTQITIASGKYNLLPEQNATVFEWMYNLSLLGVPPVYSSILSQGSRPVVVKCDHGAGLTFLYSQNVSFQGIEFTDCGTVQTSTSRNFSSNVPSFQKFQAGLYFLFCRSVSFSEVTVTRTNGTGVVLYSTSGYNTFDSCIFSSNNYSELQWQYSGGGGLYVELAYCDPRNTSCFDGKSNVPFEYISNTTYVFNSCEFVSNVANMSGPNAYALILPHGGNHLAFGRGGGLSIFLKGNAQGNVVTINHSRIANNRATWGAGLLFEIEDNCTNNTFEMYDSLVDGNECFYNESLYVKGTGGGGMRIGYIFYGEDLVQHNHMHFENCQISSNKAYWGGGISFYTSPEIYASKSTNTLDFVNCTWTLNVANIGAAIDMSIWYPGHPGALLQPVFTSCCFLYNNVTFFEFSSSFVGTGTFHVDSIPLRFMEFVHFEGNTGSALAAVNSHINFMDNCVATFVNNSGRNGGAITLLANAFIRVHEETELQFISNHAYQYGGAINAYQIGDHELISFGNCFIQYTDGTIPPQNWTSTFYFSGNAADYIGANSIFAVSLLPCLWGTDGPAVQTNFEANKKVFCWEQWDYNGSSCVDEVMTSPAYYSPNISHHMEVFPGRRTAMPIQMVDDRGINVTDGMILNARSLSNNANVSQQSSYINDNSIVLLGIPNSTANIALSTVEPRVLYSDLMVDIKPCPPGFIPTPNAYRNLTSCECGGGFGGRVYCDHDQAFLQRGMWLGYYNASGETPQLVVGISAYTSQASGNQQMFMLPNVSSLLDVQLCEPTGRTGVLCGECLEGYGPDFNAAPIQCVPCSDEQERYHWIFWALCNFVPSTFLFFFILLFDISASKGPVNGFIFFAQILTSTFDIYADGTIPVGTVTKHAGRVSTVYGSIYSIWNLHFFTNLLPALCLSRIGTLTFILLSYIPAIYPLVLLLVFYGIVWLYEHGVRPVLFLCKPIHRCAACLRRKWNIRRCIVDAFTTLLVLSYTRLTEISVFLLTPMQLVNEKGEKLVTVSYFSGNVEFLSSQHMPYLITALLVLVIFVLLPPLLLLVYPLKALQRVARWMGCGQYCHTQTGGRLQLFLENFQGCYKDGLNGTRDHRYFAGVYFILRVVLITIYAYTPFWMIQFIVQQLICTAVILLLCVISPYKNSFYTSVDATIFAILAALNALSIYNLYWANTGQPLSLAALVVQYILIFLPLVYLVAYFTVHLITSGTFKTMVKGICTKTGYVPILKERTSNIDEDFVDFASAVASRVSSVQYQDQHRTLLTIHDQDESPISPGSSSRYSSSQQQS